jgi:pimeloyl-ACP methyl ester carboxylesterase
MSNFPNVIVVPGICGTQLSHFSTKGKRTVFWYSVDELTSLGPAGLQLAEDGRSPALGPNFQLVADGPVKLGIYQPLMKWLQDAGYNAVFYSYDWRRDLGAVALDLASFCRAIAAQPNFTVIAHSMGGLVAQLAYTIYTEQGDSVPWGSTVYVNTPQGGAHWASMVLNGLFDDGFVLNLLQQAYATKLLVLKPAFFLYSSLAAALGTAIGSWPSVYQILPSTQGHWEFLDPNAALALQAATYAAGPGGVQQQWLTRAAQVMIQLVAGYALPRPAELQICGIGISTPRAFNVGNSPQALSGYTFTDVGDGTVPRERAVLDFLPAQTLAPAAHNGLLTTDVLFDRLQAWITAHPSGSATIDNTPMPQQFVSAALPVKPIRTPYLISPGNMNQFNNPTQDP